ncbi:MAG TPA: isoprenoid biosynthesis glyoxalase ElbB [Salinivirga sp.]|uniref:isoprenoid biosynthesis glyoxalase ElbB n=1 Tax=Salinivirga sp. TaxID=1970192 RepID=UPI002B4763A1|nr:isoprenoid biosynthesis glyoxalase ElbB [Salinivirga sp.]HKK60771.1 isoprenoid biosynthesis glyoxalase ElbB [Salinivirga sp.]
MNIAIVLSGNGVYDGAEVHESTLTMLAIHQEGSSYQCFAPDVDQMHVINHYSGAEMKESRNVLVESARIARGDIKPLDELNMKDYDALIFPGGFGAAKNLCTFAKDGPDCKVDAEVERVVLAAHNQKKPIGAICISPVIITSLIKDVKVTIGSDPDTISAIKTMGGEHTTTTHGEVVVDEDNKIYTTPCYMLDANIGQIYAGASAIVKRIIDSK